MRLFNKYDVLLSLHGGMGVVQIVYDEHWQRLLAIKTIREAAPPHLHELFLDEARLLLALPPHPHVVHVYFVDLWRNTPYIALEAIAGKTGIGETLQHLIDRRSLMPLELLTYALQICEGLEHIHEHGVLHLDLKPANCLLDAQRRIHVTDFGIARVRAATSGTEGFGTTGYAAPEQQNGNVSTATDVFALGCTLYAMACRTTAYTTVPADPRPYQPARDDYPAALEAIIARCRNPAPTDRYLSVQEIAEHLRSLYATAVGMIYEPPPTASLDFEARLNRAVSWSHLGEHDRARRELRQLLTEHQREDIVWYNLGNSYFATSEYPRAVDAFEHGLRIAPNDVQAWGNLAYAAALTGDDEKALHAADRALALAPNDVPARINKGFVFGSRGDHAAALREFEAAIAAEPENIDALCAAVVALVHLDRTDETTALLQRARAIDPTNPRVIAIEHELHEQ